MKKDNANDHDGREYQIQDDKTKVKTVYTEEMTPEQTVARYNQAVSNALNKKGSIINFNKQIEHTLDAYTEELGLVHALDEEQPQTVEELEAETLEEVQDSLSIPIIKGYFRITQIKQQQDQAEQDIESLRQDVNDMYKYARKMADKTGMELEMKPEELEAELEKDGEEFKEDNPESRPPTK